MHAHRVTLSAQCHWRIHTESLHCCRFYLCPVNRENNTIAFKGMFSSKCQTRGAVNLLYFRLFFRFFFSLSLSLLNPKTATLGVLCVVCVHTRTHTPTIKDNLIIYVVELATATIRDVGVAHGVMCPSNN